MAVGLALAKRWLRVNSLPEPGTFSLSREEHRRNGFRPFNRKWLGVQHVVRGVSHVTVASEECDFSTRLAADVIQYPGSFEDCSALGVLCHEVGHHVDHVLKWSSMPGMRKAFSVVATHEPEVSNFEHNDDESFAEAVRLLISNPELLRVGRPERWEHLLAIGLRPVTRHPWRAALGKAPAYVIHAAEAWIEDGR